MSVEFLHMHSHINVTNVTHQLSCHAAFCHLADWFGSFISSMPPSGLIQLIFTTFSLHRTLIAVGSAEWSYQASI